MEQIDIKQQIETMIADEHYRPLSLAQLQETLGLSTTEEFVAMNKACLLYTSPSPRDRQKSRMPSSA